MTCPVLLPPPSGPKLFGEESRPPWESDGSLPDTQICTNLGPQDWLSAEVGSLPPSPGLWGAWGLRVDRGFRKGFLSGSDSQKLGHSGSGPAPWALGRRVWTVAISGQDL